MPVICMKKRVAMCIFPVIVVLSLFMVAAANESYDNAGISSQTLSPVDENSAVNKAYQCLESQIANKSNFAQGKNSKYCILQGKIAFISYLTFKALICLVYSRIFIYR